MKLIILDRDGIINYDSAEYIKSPDEWIPIPGNLEAIAKLNTAGYKVAVATNQSGVARGFYDDVMLAKIHDKMHQALAKVNGHIDFLVYCPDLPDSGSVNRKPRPGMLLQIAEHFQCDLANVPFVGDRVTDVLAALAAGAQPIFINNQVEVLDHDALNGVPVYTDFKVFVDSLLKST